MEAKDYLDKIIKEIINFRRSAVGSAGFRSGGRWFIQSPRPDNKVCIMGV